MCYRGRDHSDLLVPGADRVVILVVLDGFGHAPPGPGNAISLARTPHWKGLWDSCPHTLLEACGEAVGLPRGIMGNSEVGHLNLGAGRVVYQPLVLINRAIANGAFAADPVLNEAMSSAHGNGRIHLMGLVSDGGVHSHLDHLLALIEMARKHDVQPLLHAFLDGRDTPPRSAQSFLLQVEAALSRSHGRIASLHGRYYAMDRDHRWDRTRKAYRALMGDAPYKASSATMALEMAYQRGEDDEFVQPTLISAVGDPTTTLESGDVVLFFNFRADRARQLSAALTQERFHGFDRGDVCPVSLTTLMDYDPKLHLAHAFSRDPPALTLGELVARAGLRQFRCAETEKYAHVTYFLNGGREEPYPGEERQMIPSPEVATYDMQPEMSAPQVARATVEAISSGSFQLVVVNLANPDMVGHTGHLGPVVAAIEAVDTCLGQILEAARERQEPCVITSDHGNSDRVLTDSGEPHTYHTLNPVPCVLWAPMGPWRNFTLRQPPQTDQPLTSSTPILADVAPTLLELMGLDQPEVMTGHSLLVREHT